mmetsp:Transcript_51503/g.129217  ORF Transcript_51503/g.129217 Transcript_51503/m.129217 type:complete len:557 (+) Transcript_51503:35-1705(+)
MADEHEHELDLSFDDMFEESGCSSASSSASSSRRQVARGREADPSSSADANAAKTKTGAFDEVHCAKCALEQTSTTSACGTAVDVTEQQHTYAAVEEVPKTHSRECINRTRECDELDNEEYGEAEEEYGEFDEAEDTVDAAELAADEEAEEEEVADEGLAAAMAEGTVDEDGVVVVDRDDEGDFAVNVDTGAVMKRRECLEDFERLSLVGQGGYGKVYQVRSVERGEVYAMKVLQKDFLARTRNVAYTRRERDILRRVRHPFIVRLHYAFQTHGRVYLVMDFATGGQLFYHLRKETMFSADQVCFYVAELVLAISHLHRHHIIHRDLKPENILLSGSGHILLTDFGFARDEMNDSRASTFCGTVEYMAPEVIRGESYDYAADWWSLGVLMYDMLSGHPPFRHKNQASLQKKILNDKVHFPKYLSTDAVGLMRGLMNRDPQKRMGKDIQKLKAHRYFRLYQHGGWKKLLHEDIDPPFLPELKRGKLDVSNFERKYTRQDNLADSPQPEEFALTSSQIECFENFTYVRSPLESEREEHGSPLYHSPRASVDIDPTLSL